jgi:hypothetical protein
VRLAQRHPQLRPALPMYRPRTWRQRLSRGLAFHMPAVGDFGARAWTATLPLLDGIGATSTWLRVLYAVFGYWYERGLADAVGTRDALAALLEGTDAGAPPDAAGVHIDVAGGLKSAMHEVDRLRPLAVTLHVAGARVAHVGWQPGAERLAGRHVAAALVRHYHQPVFEALRAAGHVRLTGPNAAAPGTESAIHAAPEGSDGDSEMRDGTGRCRADLPPSRGLGETGRSRAGGGQVGSNVR